MICDACGYRNKDNAKKCMGCGAALEPKMSEEELSAMLDEMSDRSDPLTASPFDKVMGLVFFSLSLVILLVCILFPVHSLISITAILFMIVGGLIARYPKVIWELDMLRIRWYANADNLTPNDFWPISRRISYWFLFVFAIALAVISIFE